METRLIFVLASFRKAFTNASSRMMPAQNCPSKNSRGTDQSFQTPPYETTGISPTSRLILFYFFISTITSGCGVQKKWINACMLPSFNNL